MVAERETPKVPDPHQPLVLAVDDESSLRDLMRTILQARGFRVIEAYDGASALEQAKRYQPDVILMDLLMPGLNGFEVTYMLKQAAETRDIPVLAVTGSVLNESSQQLHDLGLSGYILKPFHWEDMVQALHSALLTAERDLGRTGTPAGRHRYRI